MNTDYNKQANEFLTSTNTELNVEFLKNDYHFAGDKDKRDIYKVTIKRGQRKFSFDFGNSIANSGKYKGHKHLCLNNFGKYLFTEDEIKEIRKKDIFSIKYNEIKLNPDFKEPTAYDVLACLTKYDVGTFEDFCSEFGYDEDSKTADKIYTTVCREFDNVCKIWTDVEIELLQEIN